MMPIIALPSTGEPEDTVAARPARPPWRPPAPRRLWRGAGALLGVLAAVLLAALTASLVSQVSSGTARAHASRTLSLSASASAGEQDVVLCGPMRSRSHERGTWGHSAKVKRASARTAKRQSGWFEVGAVVGSAGLPGSDAALSAVDRRSDSDRACPGVHPGNPRRGPPVDAARAVRTA